MAKLITEDLFNDFSILTEGSNNKDLKIEGVFMQSEVKNGNGRIYPKSIVERETGLYQEKIKAKQSTGEAEHPQSPEIGLDRISHLIEKLEMDGNNVYGKAKILNTEKGKQIKALLEGGVNLGVSSRGIGSLNKNRVVNDDYKLITVDIVSKPSAPDAYVNGILESKEYIIEGNNIYEASQEAIKKLDTLPKKNRDDYISELFNEWFKQVI